MQFNLQKILKALLFSTSEPLSIKDVQAVITRYHDKSSQSETSAAGTGTGGTEIRRGKEALSEENGQGLMKTLIDQVPSLLTSTQIRDAMDAIASELIEKKEVYRMVQGPKGYRLSVHPDYSGWVRLFREEPRPLKLSPASMETLAITAYRQPITRAEVESIRGVSSDSSLNTLLEHELIVVTGRAELPGRPLQYGTTDKFLEFCGIRSAEELPASDVLSPNQLSEWIREASGPKRELQDSDMGLAKD